MNNDYDDYDVSDEYLEDQKTSEQYAEAARKANQQNENPVQNNQNIREFKYESAENQDDNVIEREKNFRQSIENVVRTEGSISKNNNQYDLDDLDEPDNDGYSDNYNDDVRQTKERRSSAPRKNNFSQNKHVKEILNGQKQIFSLLFSKRPMQVFHLSLHFGVLCIWALINILLVGSLNSLLYSKSIKTILTSMNIANLKGTSAVFGLSVLSQLATFVLLFILLFLMAFVLKSEPRKMKQYSQTIVLSTVPYSIILILAIIVSFFFPIGGIIIALAGKMHAMIYFYAGFQKGHPTRKNSPFWIFLLCIVLVLTLQVFFANLILP